MSLIGKIQTLFLDKEKTTPIFPRTKVNAVSDNNGVGLDMLLNEIYYELDNIEIPEGNFVPVTGGAFIGAVTYTTLSGGDITSSGTITGSKVYGAVYNDYAELFPRGEETEPGDLIALDLNSEEEKYIKARENSMVVGVHSNEFSHLIGGEIPPEGMDFVEYNLPKYIPVGLMGRCHVKVVGKVFKGEFICPSSIPGVGCSYNPSCEGLTEIVGRAVENKDDDGIGLVKIVLGR